MHGFGNLNELIPDSSFTDFIPPLHGSPLSVRSESLDGRCWTHLNRSPHNTSDKWPPEKPPPSPPNTHTRTQPIRLSYFLKWSVFAGRRWTNTTGGLRMGTKRKWAEKTKWVENHWKCILVTEALSNKICELTCTTGKKKEKKKDQNVGSENPRQFLVMPQLAQICRIWLR